MEKNLVDIKCHYGMFDGYMAGDDGFIYSTSSNWRGYGTRRMKGAESVHGYLRVSLKTLDGKLKRVPVHVLICSSFHGLRPSNNHEVRHLNGIRTDNRPKNLAWGTKSENDLDRVEHNLKKGIHGNNQKLSESDVLEIRSSSISNRKLAAIYGVSDVSIGNIKSRKTWRRLK